MAGAYLLSEPRGAWDGFALLNVIKGILLSTKGSETKTGSIPGSEVAGE